MDTELPVKNEEGGTPTRESLDKIHNSMGDDSMGDGSMAEVADESVGDGAGDGTGAPHTTQRDVGDGSDVLLTPKGPPIARVPTQSAGVHIAQYSNVDVLELDLGSQTVMRRVNDGSVNATQLLKLAGLERSKRQKVLDSEIGPWAEKVQGGTGKYQGTWVHLDVALRLAQQYGLEHALSPLLKFDLANKSLLHRPTQEDFDRQRQELAQAQHNKNEHKKEEVSAIAMAAAAAAAAGGEFSDPLQPEETRQQEHTTEERPLPTQHQLLNEQPVEHSLTDQPLADQPLERPSAGQTLAERQLERPLAGQPFAEQPPAGQPQPLTEQPLTSQQPPTQQSASQQVHQAQSQPQPGLQSPIMHGLRTPPRLEEDPIMETDDLMTLPPLEPQEGDTLAEMSRDIVTELFLSANRGHGQQLTEILQSHGSPEIETDVPIDDAGHTALHWAAALGKVALVSDLVSHGANCRRGNRRGESPLVRAVLVTNSSDTQTFGQLLDLLFPCLHLGDAQGRTVLHHIALTAGIPGRSDASRYYLDALLEWAVRCHGARGVQWLVDELVDAQDANGDTALNIAARLGSRQIAQQLVDIGAAVDLPNRAGLRPLDFGVTGERRQSNSGSTANNAPSASYSSTAEVESDGSRTGSRTPLDNGEKRQELRNMCLSRLDQLESYFQSELVVKDSTLQKLHAHLRESSDILENLESRKRSLEQRCGRLETAKKRVAALEAASSAENTQFNSDSKQLGDMPIPDTQTAFDADQPFRVNDENELRRLPPVLLKARVAAYIQNEKQLQQLRTELERSSLDGEAKYRQVVAQCTSSDVSKVDDILDDLLYAVSKGDDRGISTELKRVAT